MNLPHVPIKVLLIGTLHGRISPNGHPFLASWVLDQCNQHILETYSLMQALPTTLS